MNNRFFLIVLIFMSFILKGETLLGQATRTDNRVNDPAGSPKEYFLWEKLSHGIQEPKITCLAISQTSPSSIFVGTSKAVYQWAKEARSFLPFFYLAGGEKRVHDIEIYHPGEGSSREVFIATDGGLHWSRDRFHPRKIFDMGSDREKACYAVRVDTKRIYLATSEGLYFKSQGQGSWQRLKGILGLEPVYLLSQDSQYLYAALTDKVFRMDKASGEIKEIFSLIPRQWNNEEDWSEEDWDEEVFLNNRLIRALFSDQNAQADFLYIASESGLFVSSDHGLNWDRIFLDGFSSEDVTSLAVIEKDHFYVSTLRGVFRYFDHAWEPLYRGLESNQINALSKDSDGHIYAGTGQGFFQLTKKATEDFPVGFDYRSLEKYFQKEPGILAVQKMAIDYAEVNPEKILSWRRQARQRALLPSLSFGIDGNDNTTTNDSIWGSHTSGGSHYVGPEKKTVYDQAGWYLRFSWNLSDLIWSTAQTSIDTRSKLMVELRESILNQVTRLYFERRRIQIELLTSEPIDPIVQMDRQMRIEELTALLDALTGGGFSISVLP